MVAHTHLLASVVQKVSHPGYDECGKSELGKLLQQDVVVCEIKGLSVVEQDSRTIVSFASVATDQSCIRSTSAWMVDELAMAPYRKG